MKVIAVIACLLLAGCVTKSAVMKNSAGQEYRCSANGYGVISSMLASSNFDDCVARANEKGYK